MRVALRTVASSANQTKSFELVLGEGEKYSIGRADCQLVLQDDKVSRRHLQLVVKNNRLIAEDLKSSNGTYFNGVRISVQPMCEADSLRLGHHTLIFDRIGDAGQPKATEPPARKRIEAFSVGAEEAREAGFVFLNQGKLDFALLIRFYRAVFLHWRTFWTETSFDGVSVEKSLMVIAAFAGISGALVFLPLALRVGFLPRPLVGGLLSVILGAALGSILAAGCLVLLRGFLRAQGDFKSYLCHSAYAMVLSAPVVPLAALLGRLGSPLSVAFFVYVLWGFTKAFKADWIRLTLVWLGLMILSGVAGSGVIFGMLGR